MFSNSTKQPRETLLITFKPWNRGFKVSYLFEMITLSFYIILRSVPSSTVSLSIDLELDLNKERQKSGDLQHAISEKNRQLQRMQARS
jgi:hypothetical protein